MKSLNYLRYYFYLLYNWDAGIAFHIIRNEVRGEKKYNINSTGADSLKSLEKKGIDITHATIYMPVSFDLLEQFFEEIKQGRLLNVLLILSKLFKKFQNKFCYSVCS